VVVGGAGQSGLARRYRHTLEAGWMDRGPCSPRSAPTAS